MKIERMTEIETPDIQIGDRLRVGRYTATCQKVTEKGATFLLDQYLVRPMPMNKKNTNHGGCSKERERFIRDALEELPSAQPEPLSDAYMKAV